MVISRLIPLQPRVSGTDWATVRRFRPWFVARIELRFRSIQSVGTAAHRNVSRPGQPRRGMMSRCTTSNPQFDPCMTMRGLTSQAGAAANSAFRQTIRPDQEFDQERFGGGRSSSLVTRQKGQTRCRSSNVTSKRASSEDIPLVPEGLELSPVDIGRICDALRLVSMCLDEEVEKVAQQGHNAFQFAVSAGLKGKLASIPC